MSKDLHNFENEPDLPLDNNGGNRFGLPSDYFASFEDKLRKKMELQDELNEYPALSFIQKNNVFVIPTNYFEENEKALEHKLELSAYDNLQNIKPVVVNELEVDYAAKLSASIKHKIELADELKLYKTLYTLDKVKSFSVPESYFESVAERVKSKIYSEKENKVPVLDLVLDFIFGKKIAFAFGLVTIVTLSIYFYKSNETIIDSGDCKTLACLERQEILNNAKAISNFDEEQLMDLVDVNSLNKQLNSEKEKSTILTDEKLNIDSVSEEDLLDEL